MASHKAILFLCPYPEGEAPSQRFRFEQYLKILNENRFRTSVSPFLDHSTWLVLYERGHLLKKSLGVIKGFFRRVMDLVRVPGYDFIFIHREAAPIGPPIFEFIIARMLRKKIIYDFDDAIWLRNTSQENRLAAHMKWHSKVAAICRWSHRVSCGNNWLGQYALNFNPRVVYNPTTIDTDKVVATHLSKASDSVLTIGWTGTHSTLKYLDLIIPVIELVEKKHRSRIRFLVIADKIPAITLPFFRFKKWNKDTEIEDLLQIDIGIMPLTDDIWAKGKCGFKALQYMALGIPAVVSPAGVNKEFIDDGSNGFLASSETEWLAALGKLIMDAALRRQIGSSGRKTVVERYSVVSNCSSFLSLFE